MIENEKDFDYFKYILRKQENMSIEPEETLRIQADMSRPFEAKNQLEAEALAYAKAAVPDQDPDTLYKVGMEHLSKADNRQARIFFELAANKNHAESMYRLGRCYLDGIGTDEDRERA
ncbi:MAG: sel1 repeat family protein [Firmicutes bacterium]|nr:sel1 repeat family protein [Bacillota bacterium]